MLKKLILLVVFAASSVSAGMVTFSLLPGDGNLPGSAGSLVGWGYLIGNTTNDYALVTSLALSGLPAFTIGTSQQLINQGLNVAFLAPAGDPLGLGLTSSVNSPFDGLGGGLLSLLIDPAAITGAQDAGNFQITVHFLSAVDLSDDAAMPDQILSQAFTASVVSSAAPEPGSAGLAGLAMVAGVVVRRLRRN